MTLYVHAPRFAGPVALCDGRVIVRGTSAYLQRLAGCTEAAVRAYAAERGWQVSEHRDRLRADSVPPDPE